MSKKFDKEILRQFILDKEDCRNIQISSNNSILEKHLYSTVSSKILRALEISRVKKLISNAVL